jgi:hypothetical protein
VTLAGKLLPLSIVAATAALSAGYIQLGRWLWALAIGAAGACWLIGQWRAMKGSWVGSRDSRVGSGWAPGGSLGSRRARLAPVGFIFVSVVACAGLLLGMRYGWALAGVLAGLVGWDLAGFLEDLAGAQRIVGVRDLERKHLERLLAAVLLGLALAVLALSVRLTLGFGVVLLLALLGAAALSQMIRMAK